MKRKAENHTLTNEVIHDMRTNGNLVLKLAKNDIKSRYAGSFFGMVWAFVQPLMTMLVFWFVFQVGFKNPPVENVPFILWFAAGYIPWIYFNDGILSSSNCLFEYHYLVKMIRFPIMNLPFIKILSSLFIHIFFIAFLFILYTIYGYTFSPMWFQAFYYSACITFLMTGLSWIVSSVTVFFKDFGQIVNIILQLGFWATPIFWAPANMNPGVVAILKYNPLYYIVEGYRDSFINGVGFWEHGALTIYFWIVSAVVFVVGILLFRKLRPHFADII